MQWLKETVDKIIREFGSKEKIVCNGGLSVSGLQHCGRLYARERETPDAYRNQGVGFVRRY